MTRPYVAALVFAVLVAACGGATTVPTAPPVVDDTDRWEATLDRVSQAVVVLRVSVPRSFDTEGAGSYVGTGFVVDAERGIILTNRHLVQPGPVVGQAVFLNHEEVDVQAVYRDPVHDFGFFRFDPEDVRFMDVVELPLNPDGARVGLDIRVIGNDAGEKLSILSGTLARLDREAPDYGGNTFNDFNTFYYQAASSTSGGMSGSPVVNVRGEAVALNAGGNRRSASSYYLPLHRVTRALERLQTEQPITRGTIQTVFEHQPFDELGRLGLSEESEAELRLSFPDGIGSLVVEEVVPGGPSDGTLQTGDILIAVNGALVTEFVPLEAVLDEGVGGTVDLTVEREGERIDVTLEIDDLHAITPDEYIDVGGTIIHPLSYQQARNHNVPVGGLFVARRGYMFSTAGIGSDTLLRTFDGEPIDDMDTLWSTLSGYADGQRVPVRFADIEQPERERVRVVSVDRRWHSLQWCRRNDSSGLWDCDTAPAPPGPVPVEPATTTFTTEAGGPAPALARSLVMVDFDIPFRVQGVWSTHFRGTGLIVDADAGLVVVDRNTVPIALGDVFMTFGGSVRVAGEVVFVHPQHNFTVLRYDPAAIGDTDVASATLSPTDVALGDDVWMVGMDGSFQVVSRETSVTAVAPVEISMPRRPLYRATNVETIALDGAPESAGGVLANADGEVVALWASFYDANRDAVDSLLQGSATPGFHGLPIEHVTMVLEPLRAGQDAPFHLFGAELTMLPLVDARELGLPDDRALAIEEASSGQREVMSVSRLTYGTPASELLQGGDIILSLDGEPVTSFLAIDRSAQDGEVALEVLRDGDVLDIIVPCEPTDGTGVDRVVHWAGTLIHERHLAVDAQRRALADGVYVAFYYYGSPASRYGLRATYTITEVDGTPTPNLDAFIAAIDGHDPDEPIRVVAVDLDDQEQVISVELDPHYFPTFELVRRDGSWERIDR